MFSICTVYAGPTGLCVPDKESRGLGLKNVKGAVLLIKNEKLRMDSYLDEGD